ncbi:MAG: hypothetical protein U5N58_01245 [Actinomycetota bacterium]|nr:hypothetical protein [Actinomycetota bacterium]
MKKIFGDADFDKNRQLAKGFGLRNKEEMYFYNLFREYFGDVDIENILSFTQDFN